MSFYTSLSGLKAAQTDLSVTSNNVANVGSVGFKKSRAEFGDIMSASPLQSSAVAGIGTRLKSITQQFTQGSFQASERGLDMAISGQGFFVTKQDLTGGQTAFTRNGSFGLDSQRYVTDSKGNYLQVLPVDDDGNVTSAGLASTRNLQVPLESGSAKATSKLEETVNVPSDAELPSARAQYAGGTYKFDRFDPNSYNYSTSSTIYDGTGAPVQAATYYVRETAGTDAGGGSTWKAHVFVGDIEVSSDGTSVDPAVPVTLQFDSAGVKTAPTGATTFNTVMPSGSSTPISISLDYGGATKQSASSFALKAFKQDGVAAGQLDNVSVGKDGLVTATYSNGDTQKLGKVVIATFANPAGLRQLGDASWTPSGTSGEAIVGEAGSSGLGNIESGQLEQANVDITEELVALITAQRNFQANAKAIDTANQMTQIAVNLRGS